MRPSGASSIAAIPATTAVVMMKERWNTWANVKMTRVGATAETAHAVAEPTTPMRMARRRPRRSASAVEKSATSAPTRVMAKAVVSTSSDAPNESPIGSLSWPNSAAQNAATATAAAAVASSVACS